MISYLIDGVLLLALLLTSLRVGAMYRELKRLRGYQSEYVEVFGRTSQAADNIGAAVRHLGKDGRDVLERLEVRMAEGRELARRLEAAVRSSGAAPRDNAQSDDAGTYSRRTVASATPESDSLRFKNEILKFGGDNQRLPDRREDGGRHDAVASSTTEPRVPHGAQREDGTGSRWKRLMYPNAHAAVMKTAGGPMKDHLALLGECGGYE